MSIRTWLQFSARRLMSRRRRGVIWSAAHTCPSPASVTCALLERAMSGCRSTTYRESTQPFSSELDLDAGAAQGARLNVIHFFAVTIWCDRDLLSCHLISKETDDVRIPCARRGDQRRATAEGTRHPAFVASPAVRSLCGSGAEGGISRGDQRPRRGARASGVARQGDPDCPARRLHIHFR